MEELLPDAKPLPGTLHFTITIPNPEGGPCYACPLDLALESAFRRPQCRADESVLRCERDSSAGTRFRVSPTLDVLVHSLASVFPGEF